MTITPTLPTLPKANIKSYQTDATMRATEIHTNDEWDMKA